MSGKLLSSNPPPQVERLERELRRPLYNIEDYEDPYNPVDLSDPEYRKCYRLDSNGDVIELNLRGCGLRDGEILKQLSELRLLELSINKLVDGKSLENLEQLKILSVSGNNLKSCSFIEKLDRLEQLDLSYCSISDHSSLRKLPNLRKIDLSNSLFNDGSILLGLINLRSLKLRECGNMEFTFLETLREIESLEISINDNSNDLPYLLNLQDLKSLTLFYTEITDLSFLGLLPSLQYLNFDQSKIWKTDILQELSQLKRLRISGCPGLKNFGFLKGLQNLEELSIDSSYAVNCACLEPLKKLEALKLGSVRNGWSFLTGMNRLDKLQLDRSVIFQSPIFHHLSRLKFLELNGSGLSDARFVENLNNLQVLVINDCNLQNGDSIGRLENLQSLELIENRFLDWSFLKNLNQIQSLRLCSTNFHDCSVLENYSQLHSLDLRRSHVSNLSSIQALKKLRTLDLTDCRIEYLPLETLDLRVEIESRVVEGNLRFGSVQVGGNPIEAPPPEIISAGHGAIVDWFEAQKAGERRPLNEVKLILVGDGGAGKTTLMKRLMRRKVPKDEPQTDGINIEEWEITAAGRAINVHIWDFGGQEIMHATHQFFLSRRSIYVLVLDGRKEEDAEYWLQLIRSFGGDSPVLVVLNKIDQNPGFQVDNKDLERKHGNIFDFYRMSARTRKGVADLRKGIEEVAKQIELLTTTWAGSWFEVKRRLEDLEEDFIDYDTYEKICAEAGVEKGRETLVNYLNDLGTVVYFGDRDLKHTHVLNPGWVTDGVYRILNAERLANAQGILDCRYLSEILEQRDDNDYFYPPNKHAYVIGLMKKFELCFDLDPAGSKVLVPDLLEVQEPDFEFDEKNCLRFYIEYTYLPRSIFPRFLVRMHEDIERELRWRTGAVLQDPEGKTRAVVRVDRRERRITILVRGEKRREYFGSIRREFRRINGSFEKLTVSEWVPLPGHPDVAVEYAELVGLEQMRQQKYLVGKLGKVFQVRELLDGVDDGIEQSERLSAQNNDWKEWNEEIPQAGGDTYHFHAPATIEPRKEQKNSPKIDSGGGAISICQSALGSSESPTNVSKQEGESGSSQGRGWRFGWQVTVLLMAGAFGLFVLGLVYLPWMWAKIFLASVLGFSLVWIGKNPDRIWQRWFGRVITTCAIANAAGVAWNFYVEHQGDTRALFSWDGVVATSFNVVCAVALIVCGIGDVMKDRRPRG